MIETVRPNSTKQTRSYDAKGQLLQLKDVDAQGAVIVQYDFSYDASGDIVEEKVTPTPQAFPLSSANMSYGAANRLATYEGQAAQFDEDGNLTFGPLDGTMASFTYDSKRRLTQAGSATYQYDAENHRTGIHQTQFVVNSQPALSQTLVKTENGSSTYYVYGLGLIGEKSSNTYQSYHFDFRGSTVALSDTSGAITERFQYSAYGVLVAGDITKTPFLFNGLYGVMTDSNRLYHMRARFYNPEIRRFLNRDILLGSVDDGQSLNRFAFVTGNPVSFVDPFGLENEPVDVIFNESFWNKPQIRTITNCYAYSLNKPGFHQNPGNKSYSIYPFVPTCPDLIDGAKKDGSIEPKGNNTEETCGGTCPNGYHKIQIFLDYGLINPDFHVYRQDKDGSWSHKMGKAGYIQKEQTCPMQLDRDYTQWGGEHNYSEYCGTLCAPSIPAPGYWWNKMQ